MSETSTKPYLLRALHEWCSDNGYTPYIAVVVDQYTQVPPEHVQDGQITLNVGTLATNKLVLGNDYIEFQARFGGVGRQISVPVNAVRAIYARETGQGMVFEVGGETDDADPDQDVGQQPAGESRPSLAAVPSAGAESSPDSDSASGPVSPDDEEPPPAAPDAGSRPRLKIIK